LLADLAKLAMRKSLFGPLANLLSQAIGSGPGGTFGNVFAGGAGDSECPVVVP
jgi:hypothetical protein